jgi:hypothetical protein
MQSNITIFEAELKKLLQDGGLLLYSMALHLGAVDEKTKAELKKMELPSFKDEYEKWYSISMQVIKQVMPDRLDDFKRQYRDDKRKNTDFLTYGVSDYMIGLQTTRNHEVVVDGKAAVPKFQQQLNILKSVQARMESSLYDMVEILQADLFDDELEASKELNGKGFVRGAGAIAGVVLEKHLGYVCQKHGLKTKKKNPTINDYNHLLKDNDVIETPTWRFIQHLSDLRNLCDHNKDREPTKDEVNELIVGVTKITKTLF